jgi:tetracycline repressor-like protein
MTSTCWHAASRRSSTPYWNQTYSASSLLDGPAVLGLARFTELDERYAFAVIVAGLRAPTEAGAVRVDDPETVTRLLFGALNRGAMLIANSPDPVGTRHAVALSMRAMMSGFATPA